MKIRKLVTVTEDILEDGGKPAARPVRKVAAVAVIGNSKPLGLYISKILVMDAITKGLGI
jgi:hypothetical protein